MVNVESDPWGLLGQSKVHVVEIQFQGNKEAVEVCIELLKRSGLQFIDAGHFWRDRRSGDGRVKWSVSSVVNLDQVQRGK